MVGTDLGIIIRINPYRGIGNGIVAGSNIGIATGIISISINSITGTIGNYIVAGCGGIPL
jgi:hypothetical protein